MNAEPLPLHPPLERMRAALRTWPPSLGQIGVMIAIAAAYFAAGRAGQIFAMAGGQVTPVWPSTGIALAALLIFGRSVWPGVWLGSFAVNVWGLLGAMPPLPLTSALGVAAGIASGAALTAWLGAWLVRRVAGPGQPLDHIRGVLALVGLGGMVMCVLSATNGTTWLALGGNVAWTQFMRVWVTWWVGDSAGVFLFAPLLLAWSARPPLPQPRRWIETTVCLALLAWMSANVFIGETALTFSAKAFSYILIPLLVWPALRLGQRGATTAVVLIGAVAVWGTIHRWGPFYRALPRHSLVMLEWFLSVMALTALCVGALVAQARKAESERRRVLDELEARVRERTADLTQANAALEREIARHDEVRRALQQSEAFHASILDSALDCIITIDHEGRIVDFNPAAERTFGHTRDAVLGQSLAETIIPPALREAHRDGLTRVAVTGESRMLGRRIELTALRADGTEFPVELAITRLPGEPPRFTGFLRDITKRKRAEDERRHSDERFRDLFEHSPDAIFVESVEGVVLDVNPAGCRLHKMTREELVGRRVEELVPPAERETVAREFPAVAAGECVHLEGFSWTSDGRAVPVEITSRRIVFSGQPALLLHVRDITERRQLEEQFRQSQKMEAIGQLAGGLAHDFNNLLTVILGNVALVELTKGRSHHEQELIQEIGLAAERAANLTRQMLTFSRRQVMQARPLDLNTTVAEMARMLRRILGEAITLQFESSAGLPAVQADAGMMEQVLMNLAINARDAMPTGGRLTIRTGVKTLSDDEARQTPDAAPGRFACVAVSDTGSGIAPDSVPHIFEPFFTTKEAGKGTGLGLATVYGIVRQHRGWVRVASVVGKGTTFEVFLPALVTTAETADVRQQFESAPGGTETILLVEDEYSVRQIGRAVLERLGYRVLEALSGVAALQLWAEVAGEVDLLLTDLIMPGGVSGRDLAEQLRAKKPGLKFIYCSGYSADLLGKDFVLEEGVNFLQKPYEFHHLARTVRACLDARAASAEQATSPPP